MAKRQLKKKITQEVVDTTPKELSQTPSFEGPIDAVVVVPKVLKNNNTSSKRTVKSSNKEVFLQYDRLPFRVFSMMLFGAWLLFMIDQCSKIFALLFIQPRGSVDFPGFSLVYRTNTGAAFSLFENATPLLLLFSLVVVQGIIFSLIVGYMFPRSRAGVMVVTFLKDYQRMLATIFLLGGSAGNLFDRVFRGYVIDFINIHWFSTFNCADICISLGVILFLVKGIMDSFRKKT